MDKIVKKSDLYREWARVLDMCEGTNVKPEYCWKLVGVLRRIPPDFAASPKNYEFAVAILDNKPVFVGDQLYWECDGHEFVWNFGAFQDPGDYQRHLSWNPPKKTFNLNGVELPCPVKCDGNLYTLKIEPGNNYKKNISFRFNRIEDRDKVADAFIKLLLENTNEI